MKLSSKPVMMPGARCRFIDLFQSYIYIYMYIYINILMCCRAGFGHSASVWLLTVQHVNRTHYPFIWFTAHINTFMGIVPRIDFIWKGKKTGSPVCVSFILRLISWPSCWANSINTIYFATAVSPIFIPDLSPLNPSYKETSTLNTETLYNSLWGCPLHISGSI